MFSEEIKNYFDQEIWELLEQNNLDFEKIEVKAETEIEKTTMKIRDFEDKLSEIKQEIACDFSSNTNLFKDSDENDSKIKTVLQTIDSILCEIEKKSESSYLAEIFLDYGQFSSSPDIFPLSQIIAKFIKFQNDFGIAIEIIEKSEESSFSKSVFQSKLAQIEEKIKLILESEYLCEEDKLFEELAKVDSSTSIFERTLCLYYSAYLRKNWDLNSVQRIRVLSDRLCEIQTGVFQQKIVEITKKFIEQETSEIIDLTSTNQIEQRSVFGFLDKVKILVNSELEKRIRMKVLCEASIAKFDKLAGVKTAFFNYFFEDILTIREFTQYLNVHVASESTLFQILNLEAVLENMFMASNYVFNLFAMIYCLMDFVSSENSGVSKEKWISIEEISELLFEKLITFKNLKNRAELMRMHASCEFLFLEQLQKRKTV